MAASWTGKRALNYVVKWHTHRGMSVGTWWSGRSSNELSIPQAHLSNPGRAETSFCVARQLRDQAVDVFRGDKRRFYFEYNSNRKRNASASSPRAHVSQSWRVGTRRMIRPGTVISGWNSWCTGAATNALYDIFPTSFEGILSKHHAPLARGIFIIFVWSSARLKLTHFAHHSRSTTYCDDSNKTIAKNCCNLQIFKLKLQF